MDAIWAGIRLHAKALLDLLRRLKDIRNYVDNGWYIWRIEQAQRPVIDSMQLLIKLSWHDNATEDNESDFDETNKWA